MNSLIQLKKVSKLYDRKGSSTLVILDSIDLEIKKGEAVCIMGSSGAGKSTLLHIMGTLDRASGGQYLFEGHDLRKKSDDELAAFRNKTMGFVFQFHHLLTEFTALENVMMPCRIAGVPENEAKERAEKLLLDLGLASRMSHYPSEMSGGEQQRVAVARALIMKPQILFADEPTGNLDSQNTEQIQKLFFDLREKYGLTLVIVSHDESFAKRFPRVLRLKDGRFFA